MAVVTVTAKVTAGADIEDATIMVNDATNIITLNSTASSTVRQVDFQTDENGQALFGFEVTCQMVGIQWQLTLSKAGSSTPTYTSSPAIGLTGPGGVGTDHGNINFS